MYIEVISVDYYLAKTNRVAHGWSLRRISAALVRFSTSGAQVAVIIPLVCLEFKERNALHVLYPHRSPHLRAASGVQLALL